MTETAGTAMAGMAGMATSELAASVTRLGSAPRTLGEVLFPASAEEFLQHMGHSYGHYPGHVGKFAALLSWSDLNQILASYQLDAPRLRLVRDRTPIAPESFLSAH